MKHKIVNFVIFLIISFASFLITGCASKIELIDYSMDTEAKKDSVVIVQLSDFHFKPKNIMNSKSVKKLQEINPDILLLTGDIVENPDTLDEFDIYLDQWDFIPLKYAVLGNWDSGGRMGNPGNLERLKEIYRRHNITLLVNDYISLNIKGFIIRISGIDDWIYGTPLWSDNYIDPNAVNLIMIHEPVIYDEIISSIKKRNPRYCIVLAGHTHGGQIRFGKKPIILPPGSGVYCDGIYYKDDIPLIVSKGIGMSSLYIRIGAKPDMTVITVK